MRLKGAAIMKKHLRKILCGMMCAVMMLTGVNVFANTTPSMQIEWSSDYSNNKKPKLIVTFTTPAQYIQQITAVIYDKDKTAPTNADYVRVEEVTVEKGKTADIVFTVTDMAFAEADGAYTVDLKGSGRLKDECEDRATVYVIKPADIPGILNSFKTADLTTASGLIDRVTPALQLATESDASRKTKRVDILLSIQASDYNGAFGTLEDVRDAWTISDIIAYITDAGSTAEGLKSKIESHKDLLGINTQAEDYVTYIDNVCQDVISYSSAYNNNAGVKSVNGLKGIIKQYTGVRAVNGATEDTIYTVFETYKEYFELPKASLDKYNGFEIETRDKAMRLLVNKNFVKNSDLVAAFIEGVNAAGTPTDTPTTPPAVISPPAAGGNGGSGSSLSGGPSAPQATPAPQATSSFRDVPSSHWSYSYVTELASKNVIGGYDDGTFKPNNNVTREEFVKMIIGAASMLSLDKECNFGDVPKGAWYYDYVASAYAAGIVSGVDDETFGIGTNITRQDVAVIAARILKHLGGDTTVTAQTTLTDFDAISDYAQDSVKLLNSKGIINGFDDGSFMPHNALTRAEAATIISKLINSI